MPSTQTREAAPRGRNHQSPRHAQTEGINRPGGRSPGPQAEAVLLDRRYFALSTDEFKRFKAMLDRPAEGQSTAAPPAPNQTAVGGIMPAAGAVGSPEKLSADHDLTAF